MKNVYEHYDKMAVEQAFVLAIRKAVTEMRNSNDPIKIRALRRDVRVISEAANLVIGHEAGTLIHRIALLDPEGRFNRSVSPLVKSKFAIMEEGQARFRTELKSFNDNTAYGAKAGTLCSCGCHKENIQDGAKAGTTVSASATMKPAFTQITDGGEAGVSSRRLWRPSDILNRDGGQAGAFRKKGF